MSKIKSPQDQNNLDRLIESLMKGMLLSETEIKSLCEKVSKYIYNDRQKKYWLMKQMWHVLVRL